MKNIILISTVIMLLAIFVLKYLNYKQDKIIEKYKSNLGKEIIIKNDTMTIIDYSLFKEVYIMNNGKEYNSNYIQNIIK